LPGLALNFSSPDLHLPVARTSGIRSNWHLAQNASHLGSGGFFKLALVSFNPLFIMHLQGQLAVSLLQSWNQPFPQKRLEKRWYLETKI
jgi:hypothetical protein